MPCCHQEQGAIQKGKVAIITSDAAVMPTTDCHQGQGATHKGKVRVGVKDTKVFFFKVEGDLKISIARSTKILLFDRTRWEQTYQVPV